jgi:hypothetical protein
VNEDSDARYCEEGAEEEEDLDVICILVSGNKCNQIFEWQWNKWVVLALFLLFNRALIIFQKIPKCAKNAKNAENAENVRIVLRKKVGLSCNLIGFLYKLRRASVFRI